MGTRTNATVRYGATLSGMLPRTNNATMNPSVGIQHVSRMSVTPLGLFNCVIGLSYAGMTGLVADHV
ncbi:hypothetical protein E6H36_12095 [Candidatus Bathyarchaeota archaeon]|nr:MAG: hypothetical protein E6H36_12095 [Candidatus Bathyarchaeota archaeon]